MASLIRRRDGRLEIRETVGTPRGPRSRTLASFSGTLTPDVLDRAATRARRPFDRLRLLARATALGVPVTQRREERAARELLSQLRARVAIDPVLVTLLRRELERAPARPVPEELADVAEWLGAGPEERGEALRGLLRVTDRIVQSRPPIRSRSTPSFPRFSSQRDRAA